MNLSLRPSVSVCCIAAWLASAGLACAQPLVFNATSVEWRAATAQVIVRAVVEKVERNRPHDDYSFHTVTFHVLEQLKGEPAEPLQLVCERGLAQHMSVLQASRQQWMLFLEDWKRVSPFDRLNGDYSYSRFPLRLVEAIELSPDKLEARPRVLSHDLTPLTTPEMIEGAIRRYLDGRRRGELARAELMTPPADVVRKYGTHMTLKRPREEPRAAIIDFTTFKKRYGREPPADKKPPYLRSGNTGYVGVYALELMAADCDTVVRGVVNDWCFVAATNDPTGPTCAVRLEVIEALKGGRMGHVDFVVHDARDLAKLQADRQEIVVFLRERGLDMPAAVLGYETRPGFWDDAVIVCDEREAETLFADMTWHREPDEILARLRTVIERDDAGDMDPESLRLASQGHTGPPVFKVHPPASLAAGSSIEGKRWSVAYLPIDAHLEANALKWATSENKDLRWLAVRALVYFKSDENATILRALLDDTATWRRREMLAMLQSDGLGYETYRLNERSPLVHWEAWHVLCGWGYDVPKLKFE